jgi:hypothetical protein
MKYFIKLLIITLFHCFSLSSFAQVGDPVPRTVCQIVAVPVDELDVITAGTVTDLIGNDKFEITSDGCTILCDADAGFVPLEGMLVVVEGRVQDEGLLEDLAIDVRYWVPYQEESPDNPDPVVFTVEDAIDAEVGTVALLFGHVVSYSDEDEGIGTFVDDTGSLFVDFPDGDAPDVSQNIFVLGVMELNNAENPILSVIYWYPEGGEPPPAPPAVAWTIEEANSLPLGSHCLILGSVSSWTDQPTGTGIFDDNENTMGIDFEDSVESPFLNESGYAFGVTAENTASERVIEAHAYLSWSPLLDIAVSGTNEVTISWTPDTPGFVLQESTNLTTNVWVNASSGTNNPAVLPADETATMFRLEAQ